MFVYKLAAFCDRYSGVGYNANILVFRIAVSFEHRFSQFRLQLSMVVGHTVQADQQALASLHKLRLHLGVGWWSGKC